MPKGTMYFPIATNTLGSNSASISFSSIPQVYTDLLLVFNGALDTTVGKSIRFNGDTGTNYSDTWMYGNGTSAFSGRDTNETRLYCEVSGNSGNTQHTTIINIFNYSNTTTFKPTLLRTAKAGFESTTFTGQWRSTAAITSITMLANVNNLAAGSTFNLYGVLAA